MCSYFAAHGECDSRARLDVGAVERVIDSEIRMRTYPDDDFESIKKNE
jgi:hypothetical protein